MITISLTSVAGEGKSLEFGPVCPVDHLILYLSMSSAEIYARQHRLYVRYISQSS